MGYRQKSPFHAMSDELVLVTGASGFIASHVIQLLQKEGYRVRGTVRSLQDEVKIRPLRELCPNANYPLELMEADLDDEKSWFPAVKGCKYVIHLASPVARGNTENLDDIINPIVNAALVVLKACDEGVKRAVYTCSIAAINNVFIGRDEPYTEDDWPDIETTRLAYIRSKSIAEKAVWDFVADLPEVKKFELAVTHPGFVYGPALCGNFSRPFETPRQLLEGQIPMLANHYFAVVDVRDVAQALVNAMTFNQVAGKRHILVTETMSVEEMALILQEEFQSQGYNIQKSEKSHSTTDGTRNFNNDGKQQSLSNYKPPIFDNSRMKNILSIEPRPLKSTIIDMAYSMIEGGYVKKTKEYRGPIRSE